MKTLLIIAYECSPFNRPSSTIGAQRAYQFAKWLPFYGWRVIVICSDYNQRRKLSNSELGRERITAFVRKKLERQKHNRALTIALPTPRHYGFWDRVWYSSVTITDRGTFHYNSKTKRMAGKIASIFKLFTGDYSQDFIPVAHWAINEIVKTEKVDLILGEHGPDAGLFIANAASKRFNIPWIADFRDPLFQPYRGIKLLIYRNTIRRVMETAVSSVNVSEYWASLDASEFGKPVYCITNGFDPAEFSGAQPNDNAKEASAPLTFLYAGNIYTPFQKTDNFFLFLQGLHKAGMQFNFQYTGPSWQFVADRAAAYNVEACCQIMEAAPRMAILKQYNEADMLVVFPLQEDDHLYYKNGLLPGKLLEYFGAQKPIICFSTFDTVLEKTLVVSGTGLLFRTPGEGVSFFTEGNFREKLPVYDYELVKPFTRQETARQLAAVLDQFVQ